MHALCFHFSCSVYSSPYHDSGADQIKEEREEETSRLKRDLGSARKALERGRQDKDMLERELQVCVCVCCMFWLCCVLMRA